MPKYRFEFPDDPAAGAVTVELPDDSAADSEALRATTEAILDKIALDIHPRTCATLVFHEGTNALVASYKFPTGT